MAYPLKQSTAAVVQFGPFVDKTDGVTLETGLVSALDHASTGIMLAKNGGTLTIRHATVTATTYDAHGCYKVTLDTTDTNTLGTLKMIYTDAATCLPVWLDCEVMPANVYDSLYGSDKLDVSLVEILGVAQSATDLKDFADDGYDPSTNKVQGVVLVDTLTTYTGNTPQTGDSFARIGVAGAGLTNIDLPDQTMNITGNITGNLSGSVGSVTGAVGSVTAEVTADMVKISGDSVAADNLESAFDGTGSVMTLTQLRVAAANANGGIYVTNTTGPGADISSSNSGSAGVKVTGNGTGNGLDCTGGATGHGISGSGGGTSGRGMSLAGVGSSPGLQASGGSSGSGIIAIGQGTGSGLLATGGSSGGAGISGSGGTSGSGIIGTGSGSGHGIRAVGGSSGNGLNATTSGNGNGANFVGSGSGHGLAATGGNSGGNGINATVFASGGIGLNIAGDGTNPGMSIAGGSSATSDLILTHSLSPSLASVLLDIADGVETGYTPRQAMRLILSALAGKLSGAATTTVAIRNVTDAKDRITATVDADGNRTAVTLDVS